MSNKILDKAFAGEWITLGEVKIFGEECEKEFGRIKQGIIGAGIGGTLGAGAGALGTALGGDPESGLMGAAIGGAAGSMLALLRRYKVVSLSKDGQVNGEELTAVNKKGACKRLMGRVPDCSHVKAFKCPEEDEVAMKYMRDLRRGKKSLDKLLK